MGIIDWSLAPTGTTHGILNGGEMRWYKVDDAVQCWNSRYNEWIQSFFLSKSEIEDGGIYIYAIGEQSEVVTLRQQRDELLAALDALVTIIADTRHPDPDDVFAVIQEAREAANKVREAING